MDKQAILKDLKADLQAAEVLRSELDKKITQWKSEYNGEPYGNEQKGRSEIVSRDIKKQSEWQHASLIDPFVSSPDIIKCSPVTFEDREAARQNELVLNTQFCRQFDRFNFMTKAVKVLDQEGTLVVQTGWEYEDKQLEEEVPEIVLDINGTPILTGKTTTRTRTVIVKNQPTATVCRNEDIFIDPTCMDNMEKCQFVIHRYETDLSTLRKDGRYKNLKQLVKSTLSSKDDPDYNPEDTTEFRFTDKPRQKFIVHEYWGNYDISGTGIVEPIVCAWVGDVIIRMESNPFPDGKPPFIVVPFNSVPFQMHGEANAEMISDNQKVKTAILRGIMDNMAQSTNGQVGMKKGALDGINRGRFMNGKNFEFNGSPSDFWQGSYNQLPGSVFDVMALMGNEIESITGIKSFSGGITGNSLGSTATGAKGVLDATASRRLNNVRNIAENLVKPLCRKWMAYNGEFLDESQVVRITNEEFIEIKRDDLAGYIDIDISVSTAEDNAAKAQELGFLMQTGQQSMDPEEARLLRAEIARLYKMPDLAKRIETFQPQPDPAKQEIQMLQIELLRAQVENERAKALENAVDVKLKEAKTAAEMAKAGKTKSEADMKDLEFLEKESGRTHLQNMELKEQDNRTKRDIESMKQTNRNKSLAGGNNGL